MKKLVPLIFVTLILTSCAAKIDETERDDKYYNTIYRGKPVHNALVLANQNQLILDNQKKIIENQEKIIKLLEEK